MEIDYAVTRRGKRANKGYFDIFSRALLYNMNPEPNGSPWWTNDILAQCMIFV